MPLDDLLYTLLSLYDYAGGYTARFYCKAYSYMRVHANVKYMTIRMLLVLLFYFRQGVILTISFIYFFARAHTPLRRRRYFIILQYHQGKTCHI